MKKLIYFLAAVVMLQGLAFGQANAPIGQTYTFTAASATVGPVIDGTTTGAGVYQHVFTWAVTGTVSAGAIRLQQSADRAFTAPADCIAAQTVTSSGGPTTLSSCNAAYFRLQVQTPITGNGAVTVRYIGYPAQPPLSASISSSGLASAANQTNGSQRSQVCDGGGNCATITGNKLDTNASVSLSANATVNVNQIAGTATDVNSGVKSAGTIRVVLATDQPALTNKLLVTPDLPASASTSTKQSDGSQKTQLVDGSGSVIASTSNAINAFITGGAATGVAQGSTTAGQTGPLVQCAVTTGAPSYTTAQTSPCSLDTAGNLRVSGNTGVAQGSTTAAQLGQLGQGAVTTGAPTYTTGQTSPISLQTDGAQRMAVLDGNLVTLGAKADAKSTATDTTAITAMQVLKEISFMEQTPASRAVTNAGTFAVQAAQSGNWTTRTVDSTGTAFAANNPLPTRASDGTSFISDAAIGAALSSNPVPFACHNETSPTTIGNTQAGVPECDTSQRLIVVSPTAANFLTTARLNDGSGNAINSTSNALNVNCANCSGSGVSTADEAVFTAGSSAFVGIGGAYQTDPTSNQLTTAHQGFAQLTITRSLFTNVRNAAGTELGTTSNPFQTQLSTKQSGSAALGITCDHYAHDRSSTADVSLVAISGSTAIYVCGYTETGESTTSSDINLEYGTGATCGTGTANLTDPITVGTSTSGGMIGGKAIPPGIWSGLATPGSQRLCVHRSAAQTSEVEVWYTQF